jgi:hypothetical protein
VSRPAVENRVALANALRTQLECFWPGAVAILRRYPAPADVRGLAEQRLDRFLARNHSAGRRPAHELLARLRGAADGRADVLESEARRRAAIATLADTSGHTNARARGRTDQARPRMRRAC